MTDIYERKDEHSSNVTFKSIYKYENAEYTGDALDASNQNSTDTHHSIDKCTCNGSDIFLKTTVDETIVHNLYEPYVLSDKITYMPCSSLSPTANRITSKELSTFTSSINSIGFLEPLIISDEGTIIDGNKRFFAAVHLNLTFLPCIYSDDDYTPSYTDFLNVVTNAGVHFFDKAKAIHILTEKYLFTQEKVALLLNCSQSFVANKLRLLKFSEYQMFLITESELTERHARTLLRITDSELRTIAICHVRDLKMNVSASESYIDELIYNADIDCDDTSKSYRRIRNTCRDIEKLSDSARQNGIFLKINRTEDDHSINYIIKIFKP